MTDNAQLHREARMKALGESRARNNIHRHEKSGAYADTPAGVQFCRRYLEPMAQAIREFRDGALEGKACRRARAAELMVGMDEYMLAYLTVRAMLASGVRRYSLQSAGTQLSNAIEDELLARSFEDKNAGLYKAVMKRAQQRGLNNQRKAKALREANRHFQVVEELWTRAQRIQLGVKLIELAQEKLGLTQVNLVRKGKGTIYQLSLKPDILEWYAKYNEASLLSRPLFMPTAEPPQPWSGLSQGPYRTINTRLISRSFRGHDGKLKEANLSQVYRGVNGLQATPWRVNKRVLEVMQYAWENSMELPGLPPRDDEVIPPVPAEVDAAGKGSDLRKQWRRKVRAIHDRNAKHRSARFELHRALDICAEMGDAPFYYPHRLDFRGRVYALGTTLHPQSSDEMRGLLEFAEGVNLGERGVFWLGVHGANLFGNDKVSMEDRLAWAVKHVPQVRDVARDPLTNLWWTEADKPWSFLAWCFEWAAVYEKPYPNEYYVSHLPIALDGSCNGIQHYSAMLRDPVGGRAVNLVPQDKPNDIYQRVADRVIDQLKALVEAGGEDAWIASGWLQFGINRKTTKRQVMVLPYGGTYKSCMDYTWEAVQERIKEGTENPFGEELRRASNFLAKLIWGSIGDVVIAARSAMDWLQQATRLANKHGLDIEWTTPSGFRAMQAYREMKHQQVATTFNGSMVKFKAAQETDTIDRHRNASAVAPNFVHSMDASALVLTICRCLDEGINSFAMIHDSYGTHAGRTDDMARILREVFVDMYTRHDVLAEFRDELLARLPAEAAAELPPLPAKGDLDLRLVLQSDYFFA